MALNFKKIAKSATVLSDLMEHRTKVSKKDGIYHITDFDIVPSPKGGTYAICAISDTEFINGGFVLTKIFNEFVDMNDGDITATREEFKKSGGIRVKLEKTLTNDGTKNLTKVEVLED